MRNKTKVIRITLKTLNLLKDIIPPTRGETMTHYFDRVVEDLEFRENERERGAWRYD